MSLIIFEIIIFLIAVLLTAFITAAEVALSTFGEHKIEELKQKKDDSWKLFLQVHKNPEPYYGTIYLISIMLIILSVVVGFLICAELIDPNISEPKTGLYNNPALLITSFVLTVIFIASVLTIFGFLIPKSIGFKYADSLGKFFIKVLITVSKFFILPASILNTVSNFILLPFKEKTSFTHSLLTEDEILKLLAEGVKSGAIDKMEGEIIKNIIEFNDVRANEIMVPRTEMAALDINEKNREVLKNIILKGHTFIPVYEESLDHIVGILQSKDVTKLLLESESISSLKELMKPAYFIPETILISGILTEMQQRGEKLAIVTDEYGGTEGVLTIENILEEIVGELKGGSTLTQKEYFKFPDGKYYVFGSMQIADFNDTFNFPIPESDEYTTVAGFIAELSGKILNLNEVVDFQGVKFELIKKIRQKMVQFRVYSDKVDFRVKQKTD